MIKKRITALLTTFAIVMLGILGVTGASSPYVAEAADTKAERTILLYACGADLESYGGMATFNLHQILKAKFSADDDVNFIVMTGGSNEWQLESKYISDPGKLMPKGEPAGKISVNYNQIWEAHGANHPDDAKKGKLVLLDGDGITGAPGKPVKSENELMSDPKTLKAFIDYGVANYPAEKYDLILWDHGGGVTGGFGADEHDMDGKLMPFEGLIDAFKDNEVTKNGGKFDFIDFDACLMSTAEMSMAFSDYADYYIVSPETEPGFGQDYEEWLGLLEDTPDMDTFTLGKKIVDDFYDFYQTGYGWVQEGTLAVIDLNKLMDPELGFVNALKDLGSTLKEQISEGDAGNILFYDELKSSVSSIIYGNCPFVDLGNFAAFLGVANSEIKKGSESLIDDENEYTEISKKILSILADENVMYSKGTSEIKSESSVYRTADGDLSYGKLGTSGMHLYFPTPELNNSDISDYCRAMSAASDRLADGDPRKEFFRDYQSVVIDYVLIKQTASAVNTMINERNIDKASIDYTAVKDFWTKPSPDEPYPSEFTEWQNKIKALMDLRPGGENGAKEWLDRVIKQQAQDAVAVKNITAKSIKYKNGEGYRINIKDTSKRVIGSVARDITAELPALEAYKEGLEGREKEIVDYYGVLSLGSEEGFESLSGFPEFDSDDSDAYIEALINWYNRKESDWELEPLENKWYAISDAKGVNHAASIMLKKGDHLFVPVNIKTNYDPKVALLEFEKKESSDSKMKLESVFFVENGAPRGIDVKELTEELNAMPVVYAYTMAGGMALPISESRLTISKDTCDSIYLEIKNIKDIPDIRDMNGDKKALDCTYHIKDIYENKIDITEAVSKPQEALTDISLARVKPGVLYGAEEDGWTLPPVVTYQGVTLEEGEDYTVSTTPEGETFDKLGKYEITLEGKGRFTGYYFCEYSIINSENLAEHYLKEAAERVKDAQANVSTLIANGASQDEINKAMVEVMNAQNAVADAQNELMRTRDVLARDKQEELESKISELEEEVDSLTADIAELSVVDISHFNVIMKTKFQYTGEGIMPAVSIPGLKPINYTVDYDNNLEPGTATVTITGNRGHGYKGTIKKTFTITKAKNSLTVKAKKVTLPAKKLKKKAVSLKRAKVLNLKKKNGTVTYKLAKVKNTKFKKYFKLAKKTGKLTVKKGLKKGTYKLTIRVTASSNTYYKKGVKNVTVNVKVK